MDFNKYRVPYVGGQVSAVERKAYRDKVKEAEVIFQHDLEEEFGIQHGAEYAKKLFSLAWDYGHASGYAEVYGYYEELAGLVKTVENAKPVPTLTQAEEDEVTALERGVDEGFNSFIEQMRADKEKTACI